MDNAPKTDRGARRVAFDPVTVERSKSMRKAHAVERLAIGVGLTDDDVLAAHQDGTPMRPEYLAREWRALCGRAEVPALGFHAAHHG